MALDSTNDSRMEASENAVAADSPSAYCSLFESETQTLSFNPTVTATSETSQPTSSNIGPDGAIITKFEEPGVTYNESNLCLQSHRGRKLESALALSHTAPNDLTPMTKALATTSMLSLPVMLSSPLPESFPVLPVISPGFASNPAFVRPTMGNTTEEIDPASVVNEAALCLLFLSLPFTACHTVDVPTGGPVQYKTAPGHRTTTSRDPVEPQWTRRRQAVRCKKKSKVLRWVQSRERNRCHRIVRSADRRKPAKQGNVYIKMLNQILTKPISALTRDYGVPVQDMDASVNRSCDERSAEARSKYGGRVPRPLNSFMIYRKAFTEQIKRWAGQGDNNPLISAIAGISWQRESADLKAYCTELARLERENHAAAFPDYKFTPQRHYKKQDRGHESEQGEEAQETSDSVSSQCEVLWSLAKSDQLDLFSNYGLGDREHESELNEEAQETLDSVSSQLEDLWSLAKSDQLDLFSNHDLGDCSTIPDLLKVSDEPELLPAQIVCPRDVEGSCQPDPEVLAVVDPIWEQLEWSISAEAPSTESESFEWNGEM